jgi:hypothetical protein
LWEFLRIVLEAITKPRFIIIDEVDILDTDLREKLFNELLLQSEKRGANQRSRSSLQVGHFEKLKRKSRKALRYSISEWTRQRFGGHSNLCIEKISRLEERNETEFKPEIRKEIEDSLLAGSGSMFLWASLAWSTFARVNRTNEDVSGENDWNLSDWEPEAIKKRLELLWELPPKLDTLYSRLADAVLENHRKRAGVILGCLLAASRPLTIGELAEVLEIVLGISATGREQVKKSCIMHGIRHNSEG